MQRINESQFGTLVLHELLLQLLNVCDCREKVRLSYGIVLHYWSIDSAFGWGLCLFEVNQDWEGFAWQEIIVNKGVISPRIGTTHNNVLLHFVAIKFYQGETCVVKL